MSDAMAVDYSLYLVTDSTEAVLGNKDLATVVRDSINGGVTIVQYRDKMSETAELIGMAKRLRSITSSLKVPLLINDRLDVALAVGADGVHIGQDDMDVTAARELLGPEAIIGVTCSTLSEARMAVVGGASYIGIGTVFATPTKENTKSIIGILGVRAILQDLACSKEQVKTVAIGGINTSNVQRVIYQSQSTSKALDGVAIVSGIIAAPDPRSAAMQLKTLMKSPPALAVGLSIGASTSVRDLLVKIPDVVSEVRQTKPLCHNMTNLVVQNFAANAVLCIGGSPIMANFGEEAEYLARHGGSLVINMGTVTPEGIANYLLALKAYNHDGVPVLFDPVGAGATQTRREALKSIMAAGYFHVIKGNESEIKAVLGQTDLQQKGVDSSSSSSPLEKASLVKELAVKERNVAILTGATDYLSDGDRTYSVNNGSTYLSKITGSGCVLGSTVAAYMSAHKSDRLLATLAAMLVYEIAAERAAERSDVNGPGTFVPALLDELYNITEETSTGNTEWLKAAKVEAIDMNSNA